MRLVRSTGLAAGAFLLAIVPSAAQQSTTVTLQQAIELAEKVQPSIVQARNAIGTAEYRLKVARGAYLPNLSLSTSTGRSYSSAQRLDPISGVLVTSNSSSTSLSGSLSTNLELWDGFRRRAEVRASRANYEAATESYENAQYQQILQTTNQFFDVLAAEQTLKVRLLSVDRAQEQLRVSVAKKLAGAAIVSDTLQATGALIQARSQVRTAQRTKTTAAANLGRTVGFDGLAYAADDSSFYQIVQGLDSVALLTEAINNSPQVRSAFANARAAEASVGSALSQRWPSLSAGASTSLSGNNQNDFRLSKSGSLSLGMSYQVFNRFQRGQTIANSRASAVNAQVSAEDTRRQVAADFLSRFAELREAELLISDNQARVEIAAEVLRVQRERYSAGVATIVDVLTAQESLTQAQVDVVTSRFDYLRAKVQLEALIGRKL